MVRSDQGFKAVSDDLMSTLSALLAGPIPIEAISTQKKCHVTYHLSLLESKAQAKANSQGLSIALFENRNLIAAGGTTGHRTWEAALQLGQYLCQNPNIVAGRRILELGAGTGYPSILCAKHLQAEHAIASDGSDDVINNLPDNLFLNNLQDSSKITPMDLKWGHALVGTEDEKWNGGRPVDIILGADITYDRRVLPALMATLCDLFSMYPKAAAYISATARNAETFQAFLDVCRQRDLAVRDLEVEVPPRWKQNGPFYDDQLAIRLYRVSKP
jgi:predicted nicotinamide N-methyase